MNNMFHDTPETETERLFGEIETELARARAKFPGQNVTFAAMAEEFGEVAKALIEEPRANLRGEAVQLAVMAIRLVLDGDHTFDKWRAGRGLDPILEPEAEPEGPHKAAWRASLEALAAQDMAFRSRRGGGGNKTATEAAREAAHPGARRVLPEMVDAAIADEIYHLTLDSTHITCILILHNGHVVTGESACGDPAALDPDLGRDLAKGKAREKVFDLLAFLMREERHREEQRHQTARNPLRGNMVAENDALIRAVMAQVPE